MTDRPDDSEFTEVAMEPPPVEEAREAAKAVDEAAPKPDDEASKAREGEGEPEGDGDEKPDAEKPLRDEGGKFKSGAQARIDELTRLRHDAERRAARLEAENAALRSGESAPKEKPKPGDFGSYDEYVEAFTDWKLDQRDAGRRTGDAKAASDEAATYHAQAWQARVAAVAPTIADWSDVVGKSDIQTAPHVVQALMDADRGPELLYHFASNPDVVDRLNQMSPAKAAMEMGRIEASLGKAATPAPVKPSSAPPPASPVRAREAGNRVDLANADMDAYVAERRKQGARY